jgi:multisubunit Na+/H+ antiporter MnhG subunit
VSARDLSVDVLVMLGVLAELACCAGLLLTRSALDRLHYAMAATVVGPGLIAAAVVVRESVKTPGIKALLIAGVLLLLGPLVAHAAGRAAREAR